MLPLVTVLRLLRIAMGYGSRTDRIARMLASTQADVALTARSLMVQGYIDRERGTINFEAIK